MISFPKIPPLAILATGILFTHSLSVSLSAEESGQPLLDWQATPFAGEHAHSPESVDFSFNLPTRRVNWNAGRWSVAELGETRDFSAFQGVAISVKTDEPREDVGVYLALREDDGSWYGHAWAAHLVNEEGTYTVLFDDFFVTEWVSPPNGSHFDDNGRLDLDRINAVAIGVVNPFGIGPVSFSVTGLELIPAGEPDLTPLTVRLDGSFYEFNQTAKIPAGLFGAFNLRAGSTEKYRLAQDRRIHHTGLDGGPAFGNKTTHMMINTVGDRVRPSPRITHADWKERSQAYGRAMGERTRESEFTPYFEYWNEAYLNWANVNRANFNPRFYDVERAEEGGPVHIAHDGMEVPHLRWTQDFDAPPWQWTNPRDWRRGREANGRVRSPVHAPPYRGMEAVYGGAWQPNYHPPLEVADGETYEVNSTTLTAFTPWHIYDETQFTYWSAEGMLKLYNDPMLAFGEALKEANPEAVFMVGWGFRPSEDHWAAWEMVYRPTIDAAIHIADGWVDHDYGGDPRRLSANYEVVTHYTMNEHGKWLYGFNTETAMGSDPQAYPEADVVAGSTLADIAKATWMSRKVLHALRFVPDKARSFSHFGHGGGWFSDQGEGTALLVMRNLRGRLLHVENPDPDLYVVASIDGTDPLNPRPDDMPDRLELVVALLNDHRDDRKVDLSLAAPRGMSWNEVIVRQPVIKDGVYTMGEEKRSLSDAKNFAWEEVIPSRGLIVLTFPLEGEFEAGIPTVVDRQFFGGDILQRVRFQEPVTHHIEIPGEDLEKTRRVRLRFVAEHLHGQQGQVTVNGQTYALPSAIGPENSPFIREISIRREDLKEKNELLFSVTEDRFASYLLASASLILELEPE